MCVCVLWVVVPLQNLMNFHGASQNGCHFHSRCRSSSSFNSRYASIASTNRKVIKFHNGEKCSADRIIGIAVYFLGKRMLSIESRNAPMINRFHELSTSTMRCIHLNKLICYILSSLLIYRIQNNDELWNGFADNSDVDRHRRKKKTKLDYFHPEVLFAITNQIKTWKYNIKC